MISVGKRDGIGLTAFYCHFCLSTLCSDQWLTQQHPVPLLGPAYSEAITLTKYKGWQQQNRIYGKLCWVEFVCMLISFYVIA